MENVKTLNHLIMVELNEIDTVVNAMKARAKKFPDEQNEHGMELLNEMLHRLDLVSKRMDKISQIGII